MSVQIVENALIEASRHAVTTTHHCVFGKISEILPATTAIRILSVYSEVSMRYRMVFFRTALQDVDSKFAKNVQNWKSTMSLASDSSFAEWGFPETLQKLDVLDNPSMSLVVFLLTKSSFLQNVVKHLK
jgi:hypothetical protein